MFFFLNTLKKVNYVFNIKYSSYIPLLSLFMLLTLLEILSIGLIVPYMNLIFNPDFVLELKFFKGIFNMKNNFNNYELIIFFSTVFALIFTIKTFFIIFVRYKIQKFSLGNQKNLQIKLMHTYQNMDYSDFNKKKHSEYIRNIREFSATCMSCLEMGLRVTSEIIIIFSIIFFLLFLEPIPLLIISTTILFSLFLYNSLLKPMAVKWGLEKTDATKFIYQSVDDSFKGFKEIKSLGKQFFFSEFLRKGTNLVFKNDLKSSLIINSPRYFLELVIVIFIVSYLSINISIKGIDFNFLPTLAIFSLAGFRMLPSAAVVSNGILIISYSNASLNVIYDDLKKINSKKNNFESNNINKLDSFNSLEFKNIFFSYSKTNKNILDNINFKLEKNQIIGLIGETGSGKTTLVDILLGFLKPTGGKIFINEKESDPIILNYSNKIGYLPQENFIINDTLEANITLTYDKKKIDYEKLKEILNLLKLSRFVFDLPSKFDTLIGENGVKLSGGQRQKVCLARLLYHDREILVLDEATNALDKENENLVIDSLKSLSNKTIIIISHDHNNLRFCDKLYEIIDGKILIKSN